MTDRTPLSSSSPRLRTASSRGPTAGRASLRSIIGRSAGLERGNSFVGPAVVARDVGKALFGQETRARIDDRDSEPQLRCDPGQCRRDFNGADDQQPFGRRIDVEELARTRLIDDHADTGRKIGADANRFAVGICRDDPVEQRGRKSCDADRLDHDRDCAAARQPDFPCRAIRDTIAAHGCWRAGQNLRSDVQDVTLDTTARHRSDKRAVGMDQHVRPDRARRRPPCLDNGCQCHWLAGPFDRFGKDAVVIGSAGLHWPLLVRFH